MSSSEPIEISTRMRQGEWSQESLAELLGSYQNKLREMGAPDDQIKTNVETTDDGAANVHVSWQRTGAYTIAETGQTTVEEAENSRGHGENIAPNETTEAAKGLGAILGDAERSPIDAPPTLRAMEAEQQQEVGDYVVFTDDDGNTHVEDAGPAKV